MTRNRIEHFDHPGVQPPAVRLAHPAAEWLEQQREQAAVEVGVGAREQLAGGELVVHTLNRRVVAAERAQLGDEHSVDDRDRFLHAFVEHLCTYALRRVLTVDDRPDIQSIVDEAKKNEYRLRDTIRAVALSDLIRKR